MNVNDELLLNSERHLLTKMLPLNPTDLFPTQDDMMTLNERIEQLNIEINTQTLRVEIEKLKRQKLGTT